MRARHRSVVRTLGAFDGSIVARVAVGSSPRPALGGPTDGLVLVAWQGGPSSCAQNLIINLTRRAAPKPPRGATQRLAHRSSRSLGAMSLFLRLFSFHVWDPRGSVPQDTHLAVGDRPGAARSRRSCQSRETLRYRRSGRYVVSYRIVSHAADVDLLVQCTVLAHVAGDENRSHFHNTGFALFGPCFLMSFVLVSDWSKPD